ncbi:hypothetical protein B0I35DRAFT_119415 [Stachybotrys elegans]|uniref:Uncharacterized protein n=1 Tax=Stachybotrys elegans TaxID=80388 RepID=A0A8K0WVU8_9HYPO|nr:hypothetical protein B0I35DRAFT_119415 [Stachybotrys elegans]
MNHINAVPRLALPGWDQPVANNQTEGLKRLSSANRLVKTAPPPNPNTSSAVLAAPLPPPSAPVCVSTVPDKPVTSAPQEASTPVPDTSDDVKQEVQVQLSAPPSILDENEEETAGQEPLVDLKEAESDEKHLDGFNKLALQATGTITVTTESVDALERTVLSTWNRRLGDSANPVSLGQDMMALLGLIQKIRAQDSGEGSQKEQKENKGQKDNEEQKGDEATAQVVVDTTPSTNLELLQHGYTPQANPQDAAASKQRITYSADIIKSQRPSPVASPGPAQPPKL